jgi:hypothetical protein
MLTHQFSRRAPPSTGPCVQRMWLYASPAAPLDSLACLPIPLPSPASPKVPRRLFIPSAPSLPYGQSAYLPAFAAQLAMFLIGAGAMARKCEPSQRTMLDFAMDFGHSAAATASLHVELCDALEAGDRTRLRAALFHGRHCRPRTSPRAAQVACCMVACLRVARCRVLFAAWHADAHGMAEGSLLEPSRRFVNIRNARALALCFGWPTEARGCGGRGPRGGF